MQGDSANSEDDDDTESAEAITRRDSEPTLPQPAFGDYMPLDRITEADGPYRSRLRLQLADGTVLSGDAAHEYLRRARPPRNRA